MSSLPLHPSAPIPWLRWSLAAIAASVMTLASLWVVVRLGDAPPPEPPPRAAARDRAIAIAPPPPPPAADAPALPAPGAQPSADATPPTEPVAPPPVAPAAVAATAPGPGLAGGLPVGASASLPSVADLPASALPSAPTGKPEPTTAAKALSRPAPKYPPVAARKGIEGEVTVRLRIDDAGRVTDAVVVSSDPKGVFDAAALRTARRYRFTPASKGGEPIASTTQQTIRFQLQ